MKKNIIYLIVISIVIISCGGSSYEEIKSELEKAEKELAVVEEQIDEGNEDELFYSEDGKFKIMFYGEPTESSEIVPTEVGDIEMTSYLYEKSATEVYMVAYNDYPTEMVENSSIDDLLDGAKNGSSSSLGITSFDFEKDIEIEGNPGRHFKGNSGMYYAEYKLFLKGNRLYQMGLIRDGSYATDERSNDFFGSFELVSEEE